MYGFGGAMMRPGGMISDSGCSHWDGGYREWSLKRQRFAEPNHCFAVSNSPSQCMVKAYNLPQTARGSLPLTMAMRGPGGMISESDSGFSDWDDGYSEWSSKRQWLAELNHCSPVSDIPSQCMAEAYNLPLTASGSMRADATQMNTHVMSPTLYRSSHASGFVSGDSTASLYHFPVVLIHGLPYNCQDFDIYNFFAGLEVVDCLLVNQKGRFTGEAYVVFANPMQVQLALQRDRQNMGYRYVEMFACKKSDYYNAVTAEVKSGGYIPERKQSPNPAPQNKRPREELKKEAMKSHTGTRVNDVLKLRGLPYSVTKAEIVEFFGEEFDLKETDINICNRYDGKPTGEAFAKFSSTELAQKAMKRNMMTIGMRYVELFPSTVEEASRGNSWS